MTKTVKLVAELEAAITLSLSAHRGQRDKGGAPYILHPLRVMLSCETLQERIVGVLHDVMEDAGVDFNDIKREFGRDVACAVEALTRRSDEPYSKFIQRCGENALARKVKLADLEDNMDLSRISDPKPPDLKRVEKYHKARAYLLGEMK